MPVLVMVLLGCARALAAEPQLSARVVDRSTGRPVAGAEVSILGHPGERFTDEEGRFAWRPSPPPPFEVLVILPGGRYSRPVLVERLPEGSFDIEVEPLVNEALTVAAGASPNIEATPGSATTLVTGVEMQARAPANLAQTLENVAGVSTVSEGHAAVPAVRGFSAGRTLILLDGARVTAERRVGPSATFVDPFALESVEVARGPGSVAYGSDAFGGVIYARTRRVAPGAPLGIRLHGTAGAGVPHWRGGAEISKGLARGGVLLQAHAREFDDYRSPAGDVFNSGSSDRGFLGRLEHALGPGTITAIWQSDFGRDVGRPRNNSRTVRFFYPAEDSHRLTATYELQRVGGFNRVLTTAFVGSYGIVTDQDRFATASAPRAVERSDVSARDFQVRVLAERTLGTAHIEFGTDVNGRYGLEALEDRAFYDPSGAHLRTERTVSVEDAHRVDTGVFVSAHVAAGPRLLLAGGLRGDRVTAENRGGYFGDRSGANGAASGYVAATLGSFRGVSVTAQAARGFRDPLLSDRYFRGPTGRGFITGNPDLEPETSLQFDAAVRYTAGRVRAALYGFHYRIDGLVERYETATDFFFFRNRGRATVDGFEIESQADLGSGLTLELAAQRTRGRADGAAPLDGIPPPSLSVQLRRQFGARGFVQARAAAFARDEAPGPTERVMPGYVTVDLSGGWNLSRHVELRAIGRNVLDQEHLLSPDTRTVTAPGRAALLSLAFNY